MATAKTTKKTTKKEPTGKYRGEIYTILDRNEHRVLLTNGAIHFWVKADDVEVQ